MLVCCFSTISTGAWKKKTPHLTVLTFNIESSWVLHGRCVRIECGTFLSVLNCTPGWIYHHSFYIRQEIGTRLWIQNVSAFVFGLQAWADAFRSSPDLTGVVQIYEELKRKGVEFPMADLDALSPIHTPQRVRQLCHAAYSTVFLTLFSLFSLLMDSALYWKFRTFKQIKNEYFFLLHLLKKKYFCFTRESQKLIQPHISTKLLLSRSQHPRHLRHLKLVSCLLRLKCQTWLGRSLQTQNRSVSSWNVVLCIVYVGDI